MGKVLLIAILAAASLTDIRGRRIPDVISLGGCALLIGLPPAWGGAGLSAWPALIGMPLVWLAFFRPAGFGMGDAKLCACIGAGLGPLAPIAIAVGCCAGVGAAIVAPRLRQGIPLAPFLAAGAVATLCLGAVGA